MTQSVLPELPGDILEASELLSNERRTITGDPSLAATLIGETYAPARLEIRGGPLDFELDLRRFQSDGVELSLMSVGADVLVTAPPPRDRYIIAIPVSGHVTAGTRGQVCTLTRTTGIVMSPNQPVFFSDWSSDYRHLCVRIEKASLDSALSAMLHRPISEPVEFAFPLEISATRSRPLMRALELTALEMLEGDPSRSRVPLTSSISQLLINSLFFVQDHSFTHALHETGLDPDYPASLRAAQRFVAEQANESISVVDIAHAANVSVRALEEQFQRHLHMSPTAYLRETRLLLIRDELHRSSAESTTVGAVAARWGFRHAGRFSAIYRQRFGVTPSADLRNRANSSLRT
ncbi:AraC family transcriptional regulator [Mycobacterium sp. 1245852.3]|uniref:AraC family transcriptional regulator n=1 Tax=Mycobacterium sp. 1245852.3 TaxID=1856860 RepID=UPI0007FEF759|nr:AraC family transcriptional regulator [Mycobacterium sp. 1245852.3]OBJ85102.1 hypothetical protein A9W96_26565 [Mycobacterium sp. 1245852.3]